VENRLLSASAPTAVSLAYDPLGRLQASTAAGATTTFLYDGSSLVAEYAGAAVLRRYVPSGLGADAPLLWYEGAAEASPRWLEADAQGSIIAWLDSSGDAGAQYGYDPFGLPDPASGWSGARYRYTGQIMIPEAQIYEYKARVYDPSALPAFRAEHGETQPAAIPLIRRRFLSRRSRPALLVPCLEVVVVGSVGQM